MTLTYKLDLDRVTLNHQAKHEKSQKVIWFENQRPKM